MLKGKMLNLRPMESEDLELIKVWNNDPSFKGPYEPLECNSLEDLRAWYHSERDSRWFIIEDKEGEPVGQIMNKIKSDYYTIGYIIHQNYRNRGYGTEAVKIMLDFLFLSTTTIRVEAQACRENKASIRVLEKSGFRHEGTIRRAMYVQGNHLDANIYGILRNEWSNPHAINL